MTEVKFGSTRYEELIELRYRILLGPLGLKFLDSHREKEANYLHLGCVNTLDDRLMGGAILMPLNDEEVRLMQVAIDGRYQGEGIGQELVKFAAKKAKEAGYIRMVMHAMLAVAGFYKKMGFAQEGEVFEERGITFVRMVKKM